MADLTGKHFGKWTVLAPSEKPHYYTCQCECGVVKDVYDSSLRLGKSRSCLSCANRGQKPGLTSARLKKAKEKGICTYLATNPVFPKVATMNRIKWAGLDAEDFELITTYEDNCYCKPNVDYYRTILEQFHLRPEECLMVGNDVEEDLAIRKLGVKTFLVTDTKENKKDLPIESDYQGSMEELFAFVESLENA